MSGNDRGLDRTMRIVALVLVAGVGVFATVGLIHIPGDVPAPAATVAATIEVAPNFDYYRQNIEPMFARPRGYPDGGGSPACVMCHSWQTSLRFALADMTETPDGWAWTPGQSQANYDVVTQLVNASDPASSKLLTKPLSPQAGGEGHSGGSYWESTSDPEYQVVLQWIEMLPAEYFTPPPEPELDFEFYRTCVQEMIRSPKYGQLSCSVCHAGGSIGFAPRPANGTSWTEEEARRGFEVMKRLIVPGNPIQSRWMLKPLHLDGGGSYTHNGPRRWRSMDDPEWQMLAAWVRGERTGSDCSM
jgi:hypothetical protein